MKKHFLKFLIFSLLATGFLPSFASAAPAAGQVSEKDYGVNLSGGEFGTGSVPGAMNTNYIYPTDQSTYSYFHGKGLTLIRVPFLWERVQNKQFGPLSAPDIAGLEAMLTAAQNNGEKVILDMHDYGRYQGAAMTESSASAFDDVWTKLAAVFKNYPALYGYELMNEPHDLPEGGNGWAYLAQSATTAIRTVDTNSWILVPGYNWQSAKNWATSNTNLAVSDPSNKLLYSAHEYFDADGSGTYAKSYAADGAQPTTGVQNLQPFVDWLNAHNALGIITEYGTPANAQWLTVTKNFLANVESQPRLVGAVYWSAGPWWGNYPLSIQPNNGADQPQMSVVQKYPSHMVSAPKVSAAPAPTTAAPSSLQIPAGPTGYAFCSSENGRCNFNGQKSVAYGANGKFSYLNLNNGTACNNATFGDSDYGTVKACFTSSTLTPTGPAGYTFCANENGSCYFTNQKKVAYGANGKFVYLNLTNGAACNNTTFGDPNYGTVKACFIVPTPGKVLGADIVAPQSPNFIYHLVAPGDTLWGLAGSYYGNSNLWPQLLQFNHLNSQYQLLPGETLLIGPAN
jgi:endoglucanase